MKPKPTNIKLVSVLCNNEKKMLTKFVHFIEIEKNCKIAKPSRYVYSFKDEQIWRKIYKAFIPIIHSSP